MKLDREKLIKEIKSDKKLMKIIAIEEIEKQIREINLQIVMLQTKKIKLEGDLLKVKYGG